jgi:hypothetical protein
MAGRVFVDMMTCCFCFHLTRKSAGEERIAGGADSLAALPTDKRNRDRGNACPSAPPTVAVGTRVNPAPPARIRTCRIAAYGPYLFPTSATGSCQRRRSSSLTALSLVESRLRIVWRSYWRFQPALDIEERSTVPGHVSSLPEAVGIVQGCQKNSPSSRSTTPCPSAIKSKWTVR